MLFKSPLNGPIPDTSTERLIRYTVLGAIGVVCFASRLFAVLRYESVIHEFDPYFNYRTTEFLSREGYYEFWNWFDEASWYPLGRVIGQTLFPGLMTTAYLIFIALQSLGLPIHIRDVCVFVAPTFSPLTAYSAYGLTREATGNRGAGLIAALIAGIAPAYLSRSTAGGYDNEAIAIFTLVFSFYTFLRAMNHQTIFSVLYAVGAYFWMVTAWGGYVFVINVVALYVILLLLLEKIEDRQIMVYMLYYSAGTLLCFNVPFVAFAAFKSSEHMISHGAFIISVLCLVRNALIRIGYPSSWWLKRLPLLGLVGFVAVFGALTLAVKTRWSGRSMTLLDPSYAAKHVPIIASVSEHQPTAWASYHFDIGPIFPLFPLGAWLSLTHFPTKPSAWFLGIFGVLSAHFSAVMVRLMLVLAPAAACLAGLAASHILSWCFHIINKKFLEPNACAKNGKSAESPKELSKEDSRELSKGGSRELSKEGSKELPKQDSIPKDSPKDGSKEDLRKGHSKREPRKRRSSRQKQDAGLEKQGSGRAEEPPAGERGWGGWIKVLASLGGVLFVANLLFLQIKSSVYSGSFIYSNPSIVMSGYLQDGSRLIQDDFREAYTWLRFNTHPNARILSWWDYGYQSCFMANRTIIVDNNTWNNTHIATVGLIFSSPEEYSYPVLQQLDVDYVFVLFGSLAHYSGDDINKFLWMIRIGGDVFDFMPREEEYYNSRGRYAVDESASDAMKESLMYRLSYNNFDSYDSLRRSQIPKQKPLKYLEEVYTTSSWLVRIFKVKKPLQRLPFGSRPLQNVLHDPPPKRMVQI